MSNDLQCSRCATSMPGIPVGGVAVCPVCGQAHLLALIPFTFSVGAAAPTEAARSDVLSPSARAPDKASVSVQSPPAQKLDDPRWPNGTPVLVTWQNTSFEAVITGYDGQDQWEVHYPEWGDRHNDTVGVERIRPRPVVREVSAETYIAPGMALQAQWEGEWYEAEVVEALPDGLVRVHYAGFTTEWDQALAWSQLRLVVA